MINHRRWLALLLCTAMTLSSVSVLAMAGETRGTAEFVMSNSIELAQTTLPTDTEPNDGGLEYEPELIETEQAPLTGLEPPAEDPDAIKLMLNGERLALQVAPVIMNGSTYVALRAFSEAMGCTVSWSANGLTTVSRASELKLEVQTGSDLVCANGRYFYMPGKAVTIEGNLMVPVRGLAKIFTFTVDWQQASNTVSLVGGQPLDAAEVFYNSDDLLWLSRIIHAESRGEPLEGKIAVGNVVLNRAKAPQFPSTIYDVIFDKKHGTQFTPTKNGTIYNTPTEESVLAAKLCLEGHQTAEGALYFLSKISSNSWIARTRTIVAKIGNHTFFS